MQLLGKKKSPTASIFKSFEVSLSYKKMISQNGDAFYFDVHRFVLDLAEQNRALMAAEFFL